MRDLPVPVRPGAPVETGKVVIAFDVANGPESCVLVVAEGAGRGAVKILDTVSWCPHEDPRGAVGALAYRNGWHAGDLYRSLVASGIL